MSSLAQRKKFWARVARCKHKRLYAYYMPFSCFSPGCQGDETHCYDCGAFMAKCGCGYMTGIRGWPIRRGRRLAGEGRTG